MERLGYYNGTYGPLEEMTVPMNERVSWFGDGVYDAELCRNYHIFALDEHVDRFFKSAAKLRMWNHIRNGDYCGSECSGSERPES